MMGKGLYFRLSDAMIREADEAALKRQIDSKGRKPGNNLVATWEEQLALNIAGCRCERACKGVLEPIVWHAFKTGNLDNLPDLSDFIDVKGVRQDNHRLIVQKKKEVPVRPSWAYVLVSAENHPYYWIVGWAWGAEVLTFNVKELQPGRPTYVEIADNLHKPFLLQRIVNERRTAA